MDKLTKYAIFIPTTISITKVETAELFFHHIISKFGIPQQVITDRDARWKGEFWKEICKKMGMIRSVISWKFLIKYYGYSFDYLIIIMNQLRLTILLSMQYSLFLTGHRLMGIC